MKPMSDAELTSIETRISNIRAARSQVKEAENRLGMFNAYVEKGQGWSVELQLDKRVSSFGGFNTIVKFRVPMQMVQQQLIDDLRRAQRELILAEGEA